MFISQIKIDTEKIFMIPYICWINRYFTLVHEKSRKPSTWNKIFLMDQWFLHLRNAILQPRRVGLRETDGSLFLQNVGKHLARENLDSRVLLLGEKLRFFRRH